MSRDGDAANLSPASREKVAAKRPEQGYRRCERRRLPSPRPSPASGRGGMTPSLETRNLTIRFGGHVAVDSVSCAFRPGELTAIVGPNGAGKTTYFNLMSGQLRATSGEVLVNGVDVTAFGAPQRARLGLGRAFQLTNLFPALSVFENVRLATQAAAGVHYELARPWTLRRGADRTRRRRAGERRPRRRSAPNAPPRCRTATSASSKWR